VDIRREGNLTLPVFWNCPCGTLVYAYVLLQIYNSLRSNSNQYKTGNLKEHPFTTSWDKF